MKVPFSNSHHNQIFSILLQAAQRGIPVAEFNMEETPVTHSFGYYFSGPCGTTLPEALQLWMGENSGFKKYQYCYLFEEEKTYSIIFVKNVVYMSMQI